MSELYNLYKNILGKSNSTSDKSLDVLGGFAKIAAHSFCNSNIPLNDSITKLAIENCLNPDQIGIIVCEANKAVHASLFSNSDDKYITFPLADTKKIVDSLQLNVEKSASVQIHDDYLYPPSCKLGIQKISSYSTPIDVDLYFNLKSKLLNEKKKIAFEIEKTELDLLSLKSKLSKSISNFNKIASELVLNEDENKYLESLRMVYEFAKCATNEKIAKDLCKNIQEKVERVTYKTASYLEDEYVSDAVLKKCKIINSSHPLYSELKTINENILRQDELNRSYLELKNLSSEITTRIEKV